MGITTALFVMCDGDGILRLAIIHGYRRRTCAVDSDSSNGNVRFSDPRLLSVQKRIANSTHVGPHR